MIFPFFKTLTDRPGLLCINIFLELGVILIFIAPEQKGFIY